MHDWDLSAAIATTMAPDPNRADPVANIDTEESIPTVESESNESMHSLFGSRSDNDGIRNRNNIPEAPPIGPIQLPPNNQTVRQSQCSIECSIGCSTVIHFKENAVVERSFFVRLFSTMVSLSNLLFTSPIRIAQNAFKLVSGWWTNLGPELTPIQQVTKFGIDFNKTYDTSVSILSMLNNFSQKFMVPDKFLDTLAKLLILFGCFIDSNEFTTDYCIYFKL